MNPERQSCPRSARSRGFSLMEMIGVMAILAVMVGVVGPRMIRKVMDSINLRESKSLQTLAEGLRRQVQVTQSIPGGGTWVTNVADALGLNANDVSYADSANPAGTARVLLIDPRFTPSTGTDPVLTVPDTGVVAPVNARMILISNTRRGLTLPVNSGKAANTVANRRAFDNIWNWTMNPFTKAPPTGWPAAWRRMGEHLHVERVNLGDLFVRVTVSNSNFPTNVPFAKYNQGSTRAFDVTNAVDAYFLKGGAIRLYRHDEPFVSIPASPDELNITHVLLSLIHI